MESVKWKTIFFNLKKFSMPIGSPTTPPDTGGSSILSGVASALPFVGTVANAIIQGAQNRKARLWNEKMYSWQRNDALADWNMANAYNSPAAQMERLKQAGLNPNLVYGHGADAQSQGQPRSSSAPGWSPHAPQVDMPNVVQGFLSTQLQKAQLDNLGIQKILLNEEVKNKSADTLKKLADTDTTRSNRDLIDSKVQQLGLRIGYEPQMLSATLEGKRAGVQLALQKTQESIASTQFKLHEDERRALINGMTYEQGLVKILQMRQQMNLAAVKSAYDRQIAASRNQQIQATIDNIHQQTNQNTEKARLLKSTPDWGDQRALDALQSLLGGATKQGSYLNPKTYSGWRK